MSSYRLLVFGALLLIVLSGCGPVQVQVQNVPAPTAPATTDAAATDAEATEFVVPGAETTEQALTVLVRYLILLAELAGALVIGVAVVRGLLRFVPHIFGRERPDGTYTENIRLEIGKLLALALEFQLGADILQTAVAPSLAVIGQLAAIAVLRTFLNYFLEQELRQAEQRHARAQAEQADAATAPRAVATNRTNPPGSP